MPTISDHPLIQQIDPIPPEFLVGDLIQPGHRLFGVVWINPERLGGTPCFYGSRVPLKNLFDYMEANHTLDQFLEDFEGVSRDQATAVLELAQEGLLAELPRS